MTYEKFKSINNLSSSFDICKELKVSRGKINYIIKSNNIPSVFYRNHNFYTYENKLKIIELNELGRGIHHQSKEKINGYIKCKDVASYFNIDNSKVKNLIKYYNLNSLIIHKGIYFLKYEDFEFLKTLSYDDIHKKIPNKKFNELIQFTKLAKLLNISYSKLWYYVTRYDINLKPKKYKNMNYYDEESIKLAKEFLQKLNTPKYTKTSMSKQLNVSLSKIENYLNYLKPNDFEFDGKFYTQEFFDKMKQFMIKYPILMQNKVYVENCNICFDSKCEAIFYIYLKEHHYDVIYHPINFEYVDSKGKKKLYEVDFSVNGRLIELKGNDHFDNNKPIYKGKSWKEKYDCMIKNNVLMIKSSQFENHGCLKFMSNYFGKNHTFIKHMIEKIQDEINGISKEDKYYCQLFKRALIRGLCRVCVETSEIHFAFEWKKILQVKSLDMNFSIKGNHYRYATNSERNSYILSKIEELRAKGLDVSWFDQNKEKYIKMDKNNKEITIFNL